MPRSFFRRHFHLRRALLTATFATLPLAPAMAQTEPARPPIAHAAVAPAAAVVPPPDYVIGADDVLAVVFWKEPEISSAGLRVRPDGKISLPLLGDVTAAGLAPDELKQQLETIAKPFFADPAAAVMVSEINSRKVFITGEVGHPGGFRLNGPMSVLQALALAGGLTEFANKNRVDIISSNDAQSARRRFSYKAIVKGKAPDVPLKPGDTVVVW
jgi:polysaccharide biosynthesis/export protein